MDAPGFSLESRLIRRLTVILAGSFLLFTVVYLFFIQNDSVFHATEEVGELSRDLAQTIHTKPPGSKMAGPQPTGHPAFNKAEVYAKARWPADSAYAAIVQSTGEVVEGSDPSLIPGLLHQPATKLSGARVYDATGGLTVISNERVDSGAVRYRIAVRRLMTTSSIALIGLTHEFAEEILPSFLPSLLLAIAVTWFTIRVNLQPLRRASQEARAVSVDNPGQRMSTENLSSEIRPLIEAMNNALAQLESALALQQRFTANAAHELRTPLAILRARVDNLQQGSIRISLTRDIARMSRAVSQMLLTARLQAHAQGETSRVDLASLVRDVAADLAPLAHSQSRDISLEVLSRPSVLGSAMALESATRNLIENALRFTAEGGTVSVTVGPGATIAVDDSGPGISDADKSRIFEPFWRASGQGSEGTGLGLSIVSEVAALHQGEIRVEDAASGGARFILTLPEKSGGC